MSIYPRQTINVQSWYGNSVDIPQIKSTLFIPFVSSCMGIVAKLASNKYQQSIRVGLSSAIPTAYADPDKHLIVLSDRFVRGDFSAIGQDKILNAPKTVGAILGVITHEVGHFAYSPSDLREPVEYIKARTKKHFNQEFAHRMANTVEDIYIEYQIARNAPNLAWSLQEINKLMLTDDGYQSLGKTLKTVSSSDNAAIANDIANLLLYAKITAKSPRGVSSFISDLYTSARSAIKLYDLLDRMKLSLQLYDALMPTMQSSAPKSSAPKQNDQESEDDQDDDQDSDSQNSDQDSEDDDQDQDSDNDQDSSDNSESEDDQDDDQDSDSMGESEDDQDSLEESTDDVEESTDDEIDQDDVEDDQDDQESSMGESDSDSDSDSDSEDDQDSDNGESEDDQESEDSDQNNFDDEYSAANSDNDTIIDGYNSQRETPPFVELDVNSPIAPRDTLDGNKVIETSIPLSDKPFEMDVRFAKLAELARQRAVQNRPFGEQRYSGRNIRQLDRIVTDQRIFATPIERHNFQPMDVKIMLDCSSSMVHEILVEDILKRKIDAACSATLGAANGLLQGRCELEVYGHTADRGGVSKQITLYPLYRKGETIDMLARRLTELSENFWRGYRHTSYAAYSRDGYTLYDLSRKFDQSRNRRKVIIVISDGEPNAPSTSYDGFRAQKHTKDIVDMLRREDITVLSLSIDPSAFTPNNYIYGESYNVCSTDPNVIDQIVAKLMNA